MAWLIALVFVVVVLSLLAAYRSRGRARRTVDPARQPGEEFDVERFRGDSNGRTFW